MKAKKSSKCKSDWRGKDSVPIYLTHFKRLPVAIISIKQKRAKNHVWEPSKYLFYSVFLILLYIYG